MDSFVKLWQQTSQNWEKNNKIILHNLITAEVTEILLIEAIRKAYKNKTIKPSGQQMEVPN